MYVLKKLTERLNSEDQNAVSVFGDLIVFFGYFGICAYIGGYVYRYEYNNFYRLPIVGDPRDISAAADFLYRMTSSFNGVFVFLSLFIVAIFVFFVARFLIKGWSGFLLIVILFVFSIGVSIIEGRNEGITKAKTDALKDFTSIPNIQFPGIESLSKYSSGEFHLLYQDKDFLYLFRPDGEIGTVAITAISKKSVLNAGYELTKQ